MTDVMYFSSSTSRSRSRDSRYRSHHRRRSLRRCSPG